MQKTSEAAESWTFFSNYAHVLVCLAKDPSTRLRDIAAQVGITERAAQRIVGQLEDAGVLTKAKSSVEDAPGEAAVRELRFSGAKA